MKIARQEEEEALCIPSYNLGKSIYKLEEARFLFHHYYLNSKSVKSIPTVQDIQLSINLEGNYNVRMDSIQATSAIAIIKYVNNGAESESKEWRWPSRRPTPPAPVLMCIPSHNLGKSI